MSEDDQPPEEIWLDSDAIAAHFEQVRSKYRSQAEGVEDVPDPDAWSENELTKGWR